MLINNKFYIIDTILIVITLYRKFVFVSKFYPIDYTVDI